MASGIPKNVDAPKKRGSLNMQIYAAMLGDAPSFDGAASTARPRLKMRVRLEAKLEHTDSSPFFRTTLREHVERCAAYALRALDEARERLDVDRPKRSEKRQEPATASPPRPVALIGPASAKRRRSTDSRAA